MIRNAQIQAVPTAQSLAVQQILGLGIVIKAERVRELVDAASRKVADLIKRQEKERANTKEPETA